MVKDRDFYQKIRDSNECQCGESKIPPQPLCFNCFRKLPSVFQKGLYKLGTDSNLRMKIL